MTGHLHSCSGGCGRQMLQPVRPCVHCQLDLPGPIRARLQQSTNNRHTEPDEYEAALAAALTWFRNKPRSAQ